ncbi:unnamed protein product [Cercospora beticola]|nr:unnamed protein product [Cercospora beticola]
MARLTTLLGDPTVQRNILLILLVFSCISTVFKSVEVTRISSSPTTDQDAIAAPESLENPASNSVFTAQTKDEYEYSDIYKQGGASEITKVSMMYGSRTKDVRYKAALHSQRQHAEHHGHGLKILSTGFKSEFWSKYSFLLKIMLEELEKPKDRRTKWLCWVGYDVILMNAYIPLDIFLPHGKNLSHINALVTRDWAGLNSDVFFLRVNEWSTRYLSSIMSYYENQPRLQFERGSDRRAQQYVTGHLLYRNQTMLLPARWFNSVEPVVSSTDDSNIAKPQLTAQNVTQDSFREAPGLESQYRDNVFQPGDVMLKISEDKKKNEVLDLVKAAKKEEAGYLVSPDRLEILEEIQRFWRGPQIPGVHTAVPGVHKVGPHGHSHGDRAWR